MTMLNLSAIVKTWKSDGHWKIAPTDFQWINKGSRIAVSESVLIDNTAFFEDRVSIGKNCIIEDAVIIGRETTLLENSTISQNCSLGRYCFIKQGVTIEKNCLLGNQVMIDRNNHIGEDTSIGMHSYIKENVCIPAHTALGQFSFVPTNTTKVQDIGTFNKHRYCLCFIDEIAYITYNFQSHKLSEAYATILKSSSCSPELRELMTYARRLKHLHNWSPEK